MRLLNVLLALCWISLQSAAAQAVRMATWHVDGFESSAPNAAMSEADTGRLRQIAGHLKPLDADVIVLRGLPDRPLAERLLTFLKPAGYQLTHQSTFPNGAPGPSSSITLLAKKPAFVARSVEWRTTGQLDSPGGFVFAGFSSGGRSICIYVAQLPEDSGVGESAASVRRRELAGQYLAYHANWLGGVLSNQVASFYLGANLRLDSGSARPDSAFRALQRAGFKSSPLPSSASGRAGTLEQGSPASPTLTSLLVRESDFAGAPQLLTRKSFAEPLVTYDFSPEGSSSPGIATASEPAPSASTPLFGRLAELEPGVIGLWLGGFGAVSLAILMAIWLARRANPVSGAFRSAGDPSPILNLSGIDGNIARGGAARDAVESCVEAPEDEPDADAALWQARALQAEARASRATAVARSGLVPRLNRLMRERLIAWLTSQRSQLLTSHEVGAQQVMELEERLQRLQGQFHESLQTREQRIAELEQEILAKERVIRDLLRAQVRVADESTNR